MTKRTFNELEVYDSFHFPDDAATAYLKIDDRSYIKANSNPNSTNDWRLAENKGDFSVIPLSSEEDEEAWNVYSNGWVRKLKRDPVPCPSCGAMAGLRIGYGEPTIWAGWMEKRGLIELGGCMIFDESPEWKCRACAHFWGQVVSPAGVHED